MKKREIVGYISCLVFLFSILATIPVSAFDSKYYRNGEVYLLIGEQNENGTPNPFKGIYRMNNPESNTPYPTGGVRYIQDIANTIGFTVDLDRYIYPFSENVPEKESQETYMYRQVVDDVDCNHVDYGYHAYYHADHRNFNAGTDIYRSNKGRKDGKIVNASGFKSAGPGDLAGEDGKESSLPEGYVYIEGDGNGQVLKQKNKKWYKIKNNRWYSCWKTGATTGSFGGIFYWTVGDKEYSKIHKFYVNKWGPGAGFSELTEDKYAEITTGKTKVGQTMDIRVERWCKAGCLDGCGNATGSGAGEAPTASASVAFQPAPKDSTTGDRAYFYTRVSNSTNYSLKYNGNKYPESSIIGYPSNTTTYWIGVSLKDKNNDFVYALGTNVIKDWYKSYTNKDQNNMSIAATAVSNQWEQEGGIVFAYDKKNDIIYKFKRNDKDGLGTVDYEAIECADLARIVGSENISLDDIKADGFGSLYFAMSHPAKSRDDGYDPTKHFKQDDAEHMCLEEITEEGNYICNVLFKQKYSKVIFKRDYLSYVISEINRKDYAYKVYSITISVPPNVYEQLVKLPWPNNSWYSIIREAYKNGTKMIYVSGKEPTTDSLQSDYFALGRAGCNHGDWPVYETFNEGNPGQTQLAVINVPTPPEMRHIGPYKVSYLDICGPYDALPLPVEDALTGERVTNQYKSSIGSNNVSPSKTYYFMVENYPLANSKLPQDPRRNPDCDQDTRYGGFITTITDPKPNENGGDVTYEWKLWLVEDPFKNKLCELYDEEQNGSESKTFWYYACSKFILTCRVKYNWYDYDELEFGDTVDVRDTKCLRTNTYAWPSKLNNSYEMASASVRLDEIMNTADFSFMKPENNPKDVEGNDIDYKSTILGTDDKKEFWAIEPIIVNGNPPPPPDDTTLTASVERCDHIYAKDSYGKLIKEPKDYVYGSSYWSLPESSTNCFTIEPGKTFYWRMAIASQAKLFCDISNSTNVDPSNINNDDFNMVAYLLSTEKINDKKNNNYANSDPNLQFYPLERGSCWWRQKKDKDGNVLPPEVKVQALLTYKLPDGTNRQIPLHDLTGTGAPITVSLKEGETTLWEKNKPMYATMSSDLEIPPTDPFVGTLSVELSREYYYKMWIINDSGTRMKDIKVGPLPLTLKAQASIRILDINEPTIVYEETNPINLFGLTGRALATNYDGESKTNPSEISFSLRDNNAWEATEEIGVTSLYKHVENYMYNFGVADCEKYTKGSVILEGYCNDAKKVIGSNWKGIKKQLEEAQNGGTKSSHLNMRPLFSKYARDTRFIFDTSARKPDGGIAYGRGDAFKYRSDTNIYVKDDDMFDNDSSDYAYCPGIKSNSNLLFKNATSVDDGGNKFHAVMKYSMALTNIKLKNGSNMVPDGYANNTPCYKPYQFYIRSTDCSGNYTKVNVGNNKIDGYLPLNMALHVRDDIPPIPYGSVRELKENQEYFFPQEKAEMASSTNQPLKFCVVNTDSYPESVGYTLDQEFLRDEIWFAGDTPNGFLNKNDKYKSLISFCEKATDPNELVIVSGNTVKSKENFVKQLQNNVAPYFVEDNVECLFRAYSSDNAGNSEAKLYFKYYTNDNPGAEDTRVGEATSSFTTSGASSTVTIASTTQDARAMFRGPRDKFPLAIPIMIIAEDDALDFDEYTTYNKAPSDPTKVDSIWGVNNKKDGGPRPNKRIFLTSLAVFYSGLDVRVLEKSLINNE